MRLIAIPSTPTTSTWQVAIRYIDDDGREIHTMPSINLPADSHSHAQRMADAINNTRE